MYVLLLTHPPICKLGDTFIYSSIHPYRMVKVQLSNYVVATDVVEKDLVVRVADAGEYVEKSFDGEVKRRLEFSVELPDGTKKTYSPNSTTLKTLVHAWTADTEKWVGRYIRLFTLKQPVSGTIRNVIYGEPITSPKEEKVGA